jgi:hypothetical protein
MISTVLPLPVGNALRLFLEPPAGSLEWRILRKGTDTFTDQNDPNAVVAYQGTEPVVLDAQALQNGVLTYYRAFYWNGSAWLVSATASGTPNPTYQDFSPDVLSIVRDRIDAGLQVEVARGALSPASGSISVLSAPPVFEDTRWPVVTVHLLSEQPAERMLGEMFTDDVFDPVSGTGIESEGWLARTQLSIVGWTQNPDERIALRQALRRLLVMNLPVFDAAGLVQIDISQQDIDAVSGEYPAPVYQTVGTFTCMAPVLVGDPVIAPIMAVQLSGTSIY